jgi:hypothetical protein
MFGHLADICRRFSDIFRTFPGISGHLPDIFRHLPNISGHLPDISGRLTKKSHPQESSREVFWKSHQSSGRVIRKIQLKESPGRVFSSRLATHSVSPDLVKTH